MNNTLTLGILTDALFAFILGWCAYTDLKRREISNVAVIFLLGLALFKFNTIIAVHGEWFSFPAGMLSTLPFLFYWHRGGIGGGDVKLVACCSLYFGIWNFTIACIAMLFILVGVQGMRRLQKKKLHEPLPMAPVVLTGCLAPLIIKYFC